ncbi:MAG: hypothetical protein FD169_2333 [Bacillota bacterium]|nr:MAG: hypothetical protein FD169_2333 [Bacillota bacterium]
MTEQRVKAENKRTSDPFTKTRHLSTKGSHLFGRIIAGIGVLGGDSC